MKQAISHNIMRAWIAFAVLIAVIFAVNFATGAFSAQNCPANTYGNTGKQIKYFSSPLCVACWVQKPIVEKLAGEGLATFEEYNVDFCREAAAPAYIRGVPAFVINDTIVYGLQTEEQLKELIA